jgi:ankyrin repeat protein
LYNVVNSLGNYTVVSELLKCGYRSLEAKNQEGQTAVHLASRMGKDDILKKLIESGANINCRDTAGYTPLHVCTIVTHAVSWEYLYVGLDSSPFGCSIMRA